MLKIMSEISISNKDLFNEDRLKNLMRENGLSAVIGFSPENITYLSGYHNLDLLILPEDTHSMIVIWPLEGEPILLMADNGNPFESFIEDVRRFPRYPERDRALSALIEILHEKEFSGEKIGIEKRYLPAERWEILQSELPDIHWVDGTDVVEKTRHIKTPMEIELLREAARVQDRAIYEAYKSASPGDSEKSVADAVASNVMKYGADIVIFNFLASGERTVGGHTLGTDALLEPGNIVRSDYGALFSGYYTDFGRMASVGKPNERQRDSYAKTYEVQQRTIAATRPGITAEELFNTATEAYLELGIGTRVMVGHSIGLTIHERPYLAPGETWAVEEGMVMCIENGSTGEDITGNKYDHNERYMTEDMIVVTKNGCELLSDYNNTENLFIIE